MKGFIKVKSFKNNVFIISLNHIGVIRENRDYTQRELEIYPELKDIPLCTAICNMCGEVLCYTIESIKDIEKKIDEAL